MRSKQQTAAVAVTPNIVDLLYLVTPRDIVAELAAAVHGRYWRSALSGKLCVGSLATSVHRRLSVCFPSAVVNRVRPSQVHHHHLSSFIYFQ